MKKILTIIVAICLIASVICITAFAADAPAAGVVLRVSALKKDGTTTVVIEDYKSFEDGWNAAMELAGNSKKMNNNQYERIVVDVYADWTADKDGNFTDDAWYEINGDGFNNDTIYIPDYAKVTLNLNGHTINRGLKENQSNGEVIYISEDADVVINNGTIKGGFSNNGAGGIHINDGAKVTFNNVNVVGNKVKNDDGAGIAVYDGATLIMNGGSVSDNAIVLGYTLADLYGGGIYVEDSTVILTDVTLKNNYFEGDDSGLIYGAAIYSTDSTVTLKGCTVEDNGITDDKGEIYADSIIYANDSTVVIENTNFSGNGSKKVWISTTSVNKMATTLIRVIDSELTMAGGKLTNNNSVFLVTLDDAKVNFDGVDLTGNNSLALYVLDASSMSSTFNSCKFSAGSAYDTCDCDFKFNDTNSGVTFVDCDFGKATFNDKKAATFIGGSVSNGTGSIFGEGSITTILLIIALVASGVSIFLTVYYNKKKSAPVVANNVESKDEE